MIEKSFEIIFNQGKTSWPSITSLIFPYLVRSNLILSIVEQVFNTYRSQTESTIEESVTTYEVDQKEIAYLD